MANEVASGRARRDKLRRSAAPPAPHTVVAVYPGSSHHHDVVDVGAKAQCTTVDAAKHYTVDAANDDTDDNTYYPANSGTIRVTINITGTGSNRCAIDVCAADGSPVHSAHATDSDPIRRAHTNARAGNNSGRGVDRRSCIGARGLP